MIVFCPNCGTQNTALSNTRATCAACSSSFDVPAEVSGLPPRVAQAPSAPAFSPPLGIPPVRNSSVTKTNTLAILSLVAGIVCCIPFVSPALAIGCGLGSLRQIDASRGGEIGRGLAIAGIILGTLTGLVQLLGMLSSFWRRF